MVLPLFVREKGEFSLWAAPRWHLLRELLMDEDLNNVALGGFTVGKFQVQCELVNDILTS